MLHRFAWALEVGRKLVIVDYNTSTATHPVPHPIRIIYARELLEWIEFYPARKITTVHSTYLGEMYAALTTTRIRV